MKFQDQLKNFFNFCFNSFIFFVCFIILNFISISFQIEKSITPWYLPSILFILYPFFFGYYYLITVFATILFASTLFFEFSLFFGFILGLTVGICYGCFTYLMKRSVILHIKNEEVIYDIISPKVLKILPIVIIFPFIIGFVNALLISNSESNLPVIVRTLIFGFGDLLGILTLGPIIGALMITKYEVNILNSEKKYTTNFNKHALNKIKVAIRRNPVYLIIFFIGLILSLTIISIAEWYGLNVFFLIAIPFLINSLTISERQFLFQLSLINFAVFILLVINQFTISAGGFIEFQIEIIVSTLFSLILYQYNTNLREEQVQKNIIEDKLDKAQRFEALGRLAGGVAHDFNNLMQIISTQVELMELELIEKKKLIDKSSIELIKSSIVRGKNLIDQILSFGNLSNLDYKQTNLSQYIVEMEGFLKNLLEPDHELVIINSIVPEIAIDQIRIEQLITNLVTNAKDAIGEKGKITIKIDFVKTNENLNGILNVISPGEYVLLCITDNGSGIPNDLKSVIFDPFFSTKPVGKGTGLGLAMVLGIVSHHDAYLTLDSKRGLTEFKIYFPTKTDRDLDRELIARINTDEISNQQFDPKSITGRVVLVDDNKILLDAISKYFDNVGIQHLSYDDPLECLIDLTNYSEPPILMITDVIMPNLSGLVLARSFVSYFPMGKVIFTTGYSKNILSTDIKFSYEILDKPYNLQTLIRTIQKLIK